MRPLVPPEDIALMADSQDVKTKTLQPVEVAYTVHKGSYDNIQESFTRLMMWISENGYEIMGPGTAVFHIDELTARNSEDLLTELQFQVQKK